MTNREQYDLICKVCDKIKDTLNKESDRLMNAAKEYEDEDVRWEYEKEAIDYIKAKSFVMNVESKMIDELTNELIKNVKDSLKNK